MKEQTQVIADMTTTTLEKKRTSWRSRTPIAYFFIMLENNLFLKRN
jgi:hypothetical protein